MSELLAQIYAAPDDDAPRLVYADWLLQRGDPRGEFIQLQLSPKARKGGRQREAQLLEEYAAEWAAPLQPRMGIGADGRPQFPIVKFRRGFPAVVETRALNHDPMWATVTHCNLAPHDDRCHVGALRAVTAANAYDIVALSKLTKPLGITEIVWDRIVDFGRPQQGSALADAIAAFPKIRVLPALRHMELAPEIVGPRPQPVQCEWIWRAFALETLLLPSDDLAAWFRAFPATRLRSLELAMPVRRHWKYGPRATIERDTVSVSIARATVPALTTLARQFERFTPGELANAHVTIATPTEFKKSEHERELLAKVFADRGIAGTIELQRRHEP